jgi:multiple sugar transport system ATP-binding protein
MASVSMRSARKVFGPVEVIPSIDLDVADREFVTLVGPSGCGKSTLLRMIAGLESVTAGDIYIGDERVNDVPPMRRDVAMVFQNYALYPHMTAEGNMSFGLRMRRMIADGIRTTVDDAARILNLSTLLQRLPSQLSGGQRQRVAMGRAMVRKPRLFLFDEPLSNLDAKLRVQMRVEIKSLHRRLGSTSIYVTHDQIEAMTMADRIVIMNAGRIEQQGTPEELYDRPANLFVAGFIGSPNMNFLRGRVDPSNRFVLDDGTVVAAAPPGAEVDCELILGVRPEDVGLAEGGVGAISGSVIEVEPTGADTYVISSIAGHQVTASIRGRVRTAPGSAIQIRFPVDTLHWFDAQSGVSLGRRAG